MNSPEDQFWSFFGNKYKIKEATPREVVDHYRKPSLWIIHPDMRMIEEDVSKLPSMVQSQVRGVVFARFV